MAAVVVNVCMIEEPLPLDAPVTPFSSTIQLNVVPLTFELREMAVALPLQIVWLVGTAVTFGVKLTVTVTIMSDPMQPSGEVGVMV
jgi:hypothetical protein